MRHSFVGGLWPPGVEAPDAAELTTGNDDAGESDEEDKKGKKKRGSGGR